MTATKRRRVARKREVKHKSVSNYKKQRERDRKLKYRQGWIKHRFFCMFFLSSISSLCGFCWRGGKDEEKTGKDKVGGWNVGRQICKSPLCLMEEEWIPYEGKVGGIRQIEGEEKERVEWTKESTWQGCVEVVYSDPCWFKSFCCSLCCAVCSTGRLPKKSRSVWVSKGPDWGKKCVCVFGCDGRKGNSEVLTGPDVHLLLHRKPYAPLPQPSIQPTQTFAESKIHPKSPINESSCHHCVILKHVCCLTWPISISGIVLHALL